MIRLRESVCHQSILIFILQWGGEGGRSSRVDALSLLGKANVVKSGIFIKGMSSRQAAAGWYYMSLSLVIVASGLYLAIL